MADLNANITRKKKKRKQDVDEEEMLKVQKKMKIDHIVLLTDNELDDLKSDGIYTDVRDTWTDVEYKSLFDQIKSNLPLHDTKNYATMIKKIDWSKINVPPHTSMECQEQWLLITKKLRKFRTTTEMLSDAMDWVRHPWKRFISHPELPKKPLSPCFQYINDHRKKFLKKNPNADIIEASKVLAKRFSDLPEHKKQKYLDKFSEENAKWKEACARFQVNHPESVVQHPPKLMTPMMLYVKKMCEKNRDSQQSQKEMQDHYRNKWMNNLSENKKIKYINKAIKLKESYDAEYQTFCDNNPSYAKKNIKSVLTKAEMKIKDKFDGKPVKPPINGYQMFSNEAFPMLKSFNPMEKMAEISKMWKNLDEHEREEFNKSVERQQKDYKLKMEEYVKSLPENQRTEYEQKRKPPKKKRGDTLDNQINVDKKKRKKSKVINEKSLIS